MIDVTNNDATNDELLPCPFCGETPVWYCKGNVSEIGNKRTIVVKCPMCGTRQETSVLNTIQRDIFSRMCSNEPISQKTIDVCSMRDCPYRQEHYKKYEKHSKDPKLFEL